MGRWNILKARRRSCGSAQNRRRGEAGSTLVELSVTLFLITAIGAMTMQTITSSWLMQNWTVARTMTDAYAAIEAANAQRWVFGEIPTSGRWPQYPATTQMKVTIGSTPNGNVNATVYRTCTWSQDPTTLMQTYILESFVVCQDGQRNYCKLSKVVRTE